MKVAILSDFHFGYAYNSELEDDSFDNASEAIEKALDSDLILIGGDLFDSRVPNTSVWSRAIKILTKPLLQSDRKVEVVECSKKLKEISKRTLKHLPVIAIHGNHERRGKDQPNAVTALENAGILIHLHCQTIVLEKDGKKIAIHGMSWVPERFAKDVLYQWNPKPIPGCFNILMLHQSIEPYIYSPLETPSLNLSNLPKGFDLIIDGHVHLASQEKVGNSILLFPGSTTSTQFQPSEAQIDKGFYKLDLNNEINLNFVPLENNRKFFYEELKLKDNVSTREQIERKISDIVHVRNLKKPPIIRLKLVGKESQVLDQELREIERKFSGKAVISFVKELESPEMTEKLEFLRNLREQKMSIEEIGLDLLKKNLDELNFKGFDYEQVFRLLSEGDTERAFNLLTGEQKTLTQILKKSVIE